MTRVRRQVAYIFG